MRTHTVEDRKYEVQVKPVLYFRLENAKNDETGLLPPFSFLRCSLAGRLAPLKGLCHEMNFFEGLVKLVKAVKSLDLQTSIHLVTLPFFQMEELFHEQRLRRVLKFFFEVLQCLQHPAIHCSQQIKPLLS